MYIKWQHALHIAYWDSIQVKLIRLVWPHDVCALCYLWLTATPTHQVPLNTDIKTALYYVLHQYLTTTKK